MRMFLLALGLLLLAPVPSGAATTRYLAPSGSDTGNCTNINAPCQTYNYARTQVQQGDTLYFRAGSYPKIIINGQNLLANGTSNTNRTILAGYPGETVDLGGVDFSYTSCYGPDYNQPACGKSEYITVKDFRLLGYEGISVWGCKYANRQPVVYSCGSHFIRIENIERSNADASGNCITSGYGASDLEFVNVHVHHCGLNIPYDGVHPPTHGFYTCSPYTVYDRIHSHDNGGYGIQHYESYWNQSTGDNAFGCGEGAIIRNSYVHDNGRVVAYGGIIMADGHNMQVYNTIIANNSGDGLGWVYSLNEGHLDNAQTYNNTIFGNTGKGLTLGNPCCGSETQMRSPLTKNNIVYNNAGGNNNIAEVNVSSPTYQSNLCNNTTTGCTHTGDPALRNPAGADFHIESNSAARNQGVTLTTFNTDYGGLDRNQQGPKWDIGAYEYQEGGGPAFDFLVPKPSPQTLPQGSSVTFPAVATYNGGTAAYVAFSVSALPTGVSASVAGSPCVPSCTVNITLTATGGAPVGTYTTPLLAAQTSGGDVLRDTNFTITVTAPSTAVKAFPTAEGFGAADTVGGRGGVVMEVTKLTDDGSAGTFRWCAEGTGARTCVFRVGGMINLSSAININEANSYLTIAGQTAPGQGVTIGPWPVNIAYGAHDVIIRHLRHRQAFGSWAGNPSAPPNENNDCGGFTLYGPAQTPAECSSNPRPHCSYQTHHIVLDHVSVGYPCDDSLQMSGYVTDSTIQWSIVADPYECKSVGPPTYACQLDPYGASKGFIFGGNNPDTAGLSTGSMHHNMFLNTNTRNPGGGPQGVMDWRYNLVYHWSACQGGLRMGGTDENIAGPLQSHHNFVGNRYIAGPETNTSGCWLGELRTEGNAKVYVQDNVTPWCNMDSCAADEWYLGWANGTTGGYPADPATFRVATPYAAPNIIATARSSMESVLATKAGATVPFRDTLDARVITEMQNRQGDIGRLGAAFPTVPSCGAPFSTAPPCTAAPADADHDGMPDQWEQDHGLNLNNAADRNGTGAFNNGYTNLENYLNQLAGDSISGGVATFDFSLANPGSQSVSRGAAVTIPVTLSLVSGTAGAVSLSVVDGLPAGVTASFTNNPCTPTCTAQLTLAASDTATIGSTPIPGVRVNGTGGGQSHDVTFVLTVTNIISSANPIYVRKTVGSPNNSCTAAESPTTAKQSITDACQCMIVPGKVMYIEGNGNTYVEMIDTGSTCTLTGGNGPSYDTATRLEGYGTPVPVVQAPDSGSLALWLRASGDHYLTFRKLSFDAANLAGNAIAVFPIAHHIRFEDIEAKNTVGGFETFYLTGASNIELVDTFLHDAGTHALTLDASVANFLCQRCHLFNATQQGLNVKSNGTKTNLTFEATEIRNNTGLGADIGASTGTILQNLLVRSNGGQGVVIRTGASGTRVYNNTVYSNGGAGLQCESGATSVELRNNIIYGNGTPPGTANLVNNCGATIAANLQTDPLFVAPPTNLHLADGSPAIDAGENIPSILTDYDGQPRQQGQQDIGAYERTQAAPPVSQDVTVRQQDLRQAGWYF